MGTKFLFGLLVALFVSCNSKEIPKNEVKSKIENWARPSAKGQTSGAYFVYENKLSVADTLLSTQSPEAAMAQIHESFTTDDGLAGMREMKQIIVQPNEKLILKKGGLHVMLMNLKQDLKTSDSVSITLTFSQAGEVKPKLPVLSNN